MICKEFAILVSLIDFIEKLQQKPRHVRVQIMWVSVIVCMTAIFGLWLWSLQNDMTSVARSAQTQNGYQNLTQLKQDLPSLWQSLGAGVGNVFNSIQDQLNSQPSSQPSPASSSSPQASPSELPGMLPVSN